MNSDMLAEHIKKSIKSGISKKKTVYYLRGLGYSKQKIVAGYDEYHKKHNILQKAHHRAHFITSKTGMYIEELILFAIIVMSVLDFLNYLPGDIDIVKKVLSWTAVGYLIYKVQLSNIFFGEHNKRHDKLILITFLILIVKKVVHYSIRVREETTLLYYFHDLIISNAAILEYTALIAGSILLFVLAFYFAITVEPRYPSVLTVMHNSVNRPKNPLELITRFLSIFFIMTLFYLFVFDPLMEWIAIAVDAPLIVIALFVYIFLFAKHANKFHAESFLYKVGTVGERSIEKFIELFKYRDTFFLGITGLIGLHLLVDIGVFIIPYITGLGNALYFELTGAHTPLVKLLIGQLQNTTLLIDKIFISIAYLFNVIGIIMLFIMPSLTWYVLYTKKKIFIPKSLLALFFASTIVLLFAPVLKLSYIKRPITEGFIGVDIQTMTLATNAMLILFIAFGVMAFVYALSYLRFAKKTFLVIGTIIATSIFGYYIYFYFLSTATFYLDSMIAVQNVQLLANVWLLSFVQSQANSFLASTFAVFLFASTLFYTGGVVLFLLEVIRGAHLLE
ncbi:hypothetical protein GOV04_04185 [Candidatus Woesearchaeota archaeon]|nr:hypothetical protein [Candidatus Woesearchaeota archaeon]